MSSKRFSRLETVSLLYTLTLLVWYLLWHFFGERWWWMVALSRNAPALLTPSLFLLGGSLRRRNGRALVFFLVPLAIFIHLYGPLFVPRRAPSPNFDVSVMSFNALFTNKDYAGIANIILTHQPDLVALQEVQPTMMNSLTRRLGAEYPYSRTANFVRLSTTAIFSRYPLDAVTIVDLGYTRSAIIANVEIGGRTVTLVSAHLLAYGLLNYPIREYPTQIAEKAQAQVEQAQTLIDVLNTRNTDAIIFACDCNAKETSDTTRYLATVLLNAAHKTGWQFGPQLVADVRADLDIRHIDYVFYGGAITPVALYVIKDNTGSDHQPLLALFMLEP